jgi:hypothetical protein
MKLSQLLKLQAIYMLLGISYNLVSLFMVSTGSRPLSSTSAYLGIVTLLIYGVFLLFGHFGRLKLYRLLMLISFVVFGYGGVISHLLNFSRLDLYYSFGAWLLAIIINLMGVSLNFMAMTGGFATDKSLQN